MRPMLGVTKRHIDSLLPGTGIFVDTLEVLVHMCVCSADPSTSSCPCHQILAPNQALGNVCALFSIYTNTIIIV